MIIFDLCSVLAVWRLGSNPGRFQPRTCDLVTGITVSIRAVYSTFHYT